MLDRPEILVGDHVGVVASHATWIFKVGATGLEPMTCWL